MFDSSYIQINLYISKVKQLKKTKMENTLNNLEKGMKDLKNALKNKLMSVNEYSTLVYQLHKKDKNK